MIAIALRYAAAAALTIAATRVLWPDLDAGPLALSTVLTLAAMAALHALWRAEPSSLEPRRTPPYAFDLGAAAVFTMILWLLPPGGDLWYALAGGGTVLVMLGLLRLGWALEKRARSSRAGLRDRGR